MTTEMTVLPTKKAMAEQLAENWNKISLAVLNGLGGRRRMIERLREQIRYSYERREEVIMTAESGASGALLCHEALEAEFKALLDANLEIPASLKTYMVRRDKWPKRKPGRHIDEWDYRERDIAYLILISAACEMWGLDVDHNPANDRPSAVEVVSAALKLKGIKKGSSPKRLSAIVTREMKWFKSVGWSIT
jgi:hypothetical protein